MATQSDTYGIGATRINVGLSAIIRVQPTAYQSGEVLKIFAGGGTLEIVPIPVALTGSSASGWGLGYPIGANEAVNIGGPAVFYLAASGATMTASMYFSLSASGVSVLT